MILIWDVKILGDVVDIRSLNFYLCLYGISKKRIKEKGEREKGNMIILNFEC